MAIFDALFGRKKKGPSFDPRVEISQLSAMSPPSTLVYLPTPGADPEDDPEDLGKSFFLRRDKKIYSEGANIYITSPDNLKSANSEISSLPRRTSSTRGATATLVREAIAESRG